VNWAKLDAGKTEELLQAELTARRSIRAASKEKHFPKPRRLVQQLSFQSLFPEDSLRMPLSGEEIGAFIANRLRPTIGSAKHQLVPSLQPFPAKR